MSETMYPELTKRHIEAVRQRVSERDCCTTPALSIENLEDVIVELAAEIERRNEITKTISSALDKMRHEFHP